MIPVMCGRVLLTGALLSPPFHSANSPYSLTPSLPTLSDPVQYESEAGESSWTAPFADAVELVNGRPLKKGWRRCSDDEDVWFESDAGESAQVQQARPVLHLSPRTLPY